MRVPGPQRRQRQRQRGPEPRRDALRAPVEQPPVRLQRRLPPHRLLPPAELLALARSQADYILGRNPLRLSYMVGYGRRFPVRVHHRGASIVAHKANSRFIGCMQGFDDWFGRGRANPNVLAGAIVGGPNSRDEFRDDRGNYMQTEACTYNTAPMVGVFARLHRLATAEEGCRRGTMADDEAECR